MISFTSKWLVICFVFLFYLYACWIKSLIWKGQKFFHFSILSLWTEGVWYSLVSMLNCSVFLSIRKLISFYSEHYLLIWFKTQDLINALNFKVCLSVVTRWFWQRNQCKNKMSSFDLCIMWIIFEFNSWIITTQLFFYSKIS